MPNTEVAEGPWIKYQHVAPAPAFDRNAALAETDAALGLPAGFSAAQIQVESGGNPKARSSAGAMGLAQVMPETLAVVSKRLGRELDPDNEKDAVDIHREVMRENLAKFKDPAKALMAYNGGWNPDKWGNPETAAYVGKVKAAMKSGQNPVMAAAEKVANAVIPSAQAAEAGKPWERYASPATPAAADETGPWTRYAASAEPETQKRSTMDNVVQGAGNLLAGAVRGAGSIGATLVAPYDIAKDALDGKGLSLASSRQRRADMDAGLQAMGAEPESWMYKGGKLGAEVAGTLGVGGGLASGVRAAGATKAMSGLEPITNAVAAGLETGGFRVGELAGTVPGAVARVATGAATGGVSSALVNPEDAGVGAVVGGAVPAAVRGTGQAFYKARQAMQSILGAASPEVRQLATRAQELGINIPADRILDSKALNAMASSLNYVPLSGRTATEDAMNAQLNRALSRTFGQDTPNVAGALRKAGDDLGGKFDTVLQANTVKITPTFKQALADAENQATNELGQEGASIIHKQIANILTKGTTGEIDGQAAYNIKKTLDRIGQRNTPEAFYARDLKKSLMNALNDSLRAEEAQSFKTLRQQYGNMLALENLAGNGTEGGISVARLANLKHINNPDLQELADIAAQFVKPREGAHGQAQRVFGAGGVSTAAALGAMGVPVAGAAAIAAGGVMGAGRVANKVLNSRTMRNAVLKPALQDGSEPAAMGTLTKGATRALPLLGAAAMANAQPQAEPPVRIDLSGMAQPDSEQPVADPAQDPGAQNQPPVPEAFQSAAEIDPAHAFTSRPRPDGTLAIAGDTQALRSMLTAAGIPARSLVPTKDGLLVGRTQAGRVQEAIDRMNAAPADQGTAEAQGAMQGDGAGLALAEGVSEVPVGLSPDPAPAPIDIAAHDAATSPHNDLPEPTEAQKRAGNYPLGHDQIAGMDISIENPQGSVRRGVDPDGKPWQTQMAHHYGYLKKTTANDGDKLDVFVKPGTPRDFNGPVFVIDQVDPNTGKLDEHKTILGAKDEAEAKEIYRSNYAADWKGMGSITRLPLPAFKAWAASGDKKHPLGDLQGDQAEEPRAQAAASTDQPGQPALSQSPDPAQFAQQQKNASVDRIQALRDAGENTVADLLHRDKTMGDVQTELASMQAATPDPQHHASATFSQHYQQQRLAGMKPAEASAHAGIVAAVQDIGPKIGLSEKAIKLLAEKLNDTPIDAAPGVVERFTQGLIKRGLVQPFEGSDQIASIITQARDQAMHGALNSLYGDSPETALS